MCNLRHVHDVTGIKVMPRGEAGSASDPLCLHLYGRTGTPLSARDEALRLCLDLVGSVCRQGAACGGGTAP